MQRCIGDDAAHARIASHQPGHPTRLIERLVIAAVGLYEDHPADLVAAGVVIFRAEMPPQGRVPVEPRVPTRLRVPEMDVGVDDHRVQAALQGSASEAGLLPDTHAVPPGNANSSTEAPRIRAPAPGSVGARYRPPRTTAGTSKCPCR